MVVCVGCLNDKLVRERSVSSCACWTLAQWDLTFINNYFKTNNDTSSTVVASCSWNFDMNNLESAPCQLLNCQSHHLQTMALFGWRLLQHWLNASQLLQLHKKSQNWHIWKCMGRCSHCQRSCYRGEGCESVRVCVVPWIQLCIEEIGEDVDKGTSAPPAADLQNYQSSILENQYFQVGHIALLIFWLSQQNKIHAGIYPVEE